MVKLKDLLNMCLNMNNTTTVRIGYFTDYAKNEFYVYDSPLEIDMYFLEKYVRIFWIKGDIIEIELEDIYNAAN